MRLSRHMAVSAAVSGGAYALSGSVPLAVSSFFTGFLIDLDHIFDYWFQHPFSTDLWHFFEICEEYRLKKVFLLAHSLEFFPLLALFSYYTRDPWVVGFSVGWAQHMAFDVAFNRSFWFSYFLTARAAKGFECGRIFRVPEGAASAGGCDGRY